ncbi:MAG: hypothetical protein A2Y25_06005 [Candidatus Melainabacteria bacterium GWF2_37_15]|nr:MAG: hypothetical protein A2Y25_06005 [Candidatus Melainabacteria bacterium GWF2_37_15]
MKSEFKEIEKRIYELEKKLKIVDPYSLEKWERIQLYAFSRALQEISKEEYKLLELPDYLKFAEKIYERLAKYYIEEHRKQERWRKEDEEYREKERQRREIRKQRKLEELKKKEEEKLRKQEEFNRHCERSKGSHRHVERSETSRDSSALPQNDVKENPSPPRKSILFPDRINWDEYG